jgi:hypothetical protein
MSSVVRAPSQVRPNAFYRARAAVPFLDETGASAGGEIPINNFVVDMGKTVYLANGDILRKVKLMDGATSGRHEGYIYLVRAAISTADIAAL